MSWLVVQGYAHWVRNLYRYVGKNPGQPIQDPEIRKFLAKIDDSCQDWQVQQAQDVIRLYLYVQSQPKSTQVTKSCQSERLWSAAVDQMIATMRLKHLWLRTEKTHLSWIRQFFKYVKGLARKDLGSQHVKNFLTHLAVERKVARAAQNQAFNSVLFFCRNVLREEIGDLWQVVRANKPYLLPLKHKMMKMILTIGKIFD